jgi:spermidine synthase
MTRALALLLTVFTGFTGLVYEVSWQKLLATLLGSHSEATAAILAIFLGGLSAGYALFGRVTHEVVARAARRDRPPRLLRLYGGVEAGIGVWALLFPWLFRGVQSLSIAIPHGAGGLGFALDVGLSALLIGPPTVLMGGTIPILTQALARGLEDATRFHAFVYASNTAGAFVGALAAGFVLVPWLGLDGVLRSMGCLNLGAGALFVALGSLDPSGSQIKAPPQSEPGRAVPLPQSEPGTAMALPRGFAACALAALLSGFAMMAIQTVLNRVGALSFGASQFTFAMVVAVFVLCIALGSLAVSLLRRIPPAAIVLSQWLLVCLLVLVYLQIDNAPYYAHRLRSHFHDAESGFYPYFGAAFLGMLVVLALPIGLSGATLPLLFHHLRREAGDLGRVAGRLYSWNTLGSLLGALVGGYVLLLWLDLHHVYRVALAALALAAAVLSVRVLGLSWLRVAAFGLAPALLVVAALPAWRPERLNAGLFRLHKAQPTTFVGADALYGAVNAGRVFRFHDDDPVSSVAVVEYPGAGQGLSRSIVNNGKSDGSIPTDYATMELAGLLPALLAEQPERALVIGFGTGVTAAALASLHDVKDVDVAEISPGVIEAAPLFDYGNGGASQNPKIHLQRTDAYRALLRSDRQYDMIVSEPSNPWVTGVEMLYSREFLESAKARLSAGGVYAQWFHIYETDEATVELVLRTYDAVFDHVAVWYSQSADLILLGFKDPARGLDLQTLEQRAALPDYAAGLARAGVRSVPALLSHEALPLGVLRATALAGDIHTLLHPVLSHRAASSFFRGKSAHLPVTALPAAARVGAENSLLRRYAAHHGGALSLSERAAVLKTVCELHRPDCVTLLTAWEEDEPDRSARAGLRGTATRALAALPAGAEARIQRLLGRGDDPPGAVPADEIERDTSVFVNFYTHAAPFDRTVLASRWARCEDPDARRCPRGRETAEAHLGSLAAPQTAVRRADP